MSNFNFSGVQVAEENSGSTFQRVEPGFQKLTITKVEDATAGTGSKGFKLTFESDKGGEFNQSWYVQNAAGQMNAKVAESFQYLVNTFTGKPLTGDVNTMALSAVLVGKAAEVTVGGRKYTNEKDGVSYNNIAAELPFGGYAGERTPYIRGEWVADTQSTSEVGMPQLAQATQDSGDGLPW